MARAGRFGTKGLAITFVSKENDAKVLNSVQDRFEVNIMELPDEIEVAAYSMSLNWCEVAVSCLLLQLNRYNCFQKMFSTH